MAEADLIKVELEWYKQIIEHLTKVLDSTQMSDSEWYKQIIEHVTKVLDSTQMSDSEKLASAWWLVKQLKKSDRDD